MVTRNEVELSASKLERQALEVRRWEQELQPCNLDDAMMTLAPMFACLPLARQRDEAGILAGFRLVVGMYPLWAIREAVAAFIAGKVQAHQSEFCPNTDVFGRELERRVSHARDRLQRVRRMAEEEGRLADEEAKGAERLAPELKAMGNRHVAKLRASSQVSRLGPRSPIFPDKNGRAWMPGPPLTPADVAHLPDAPSSGSGVARPVGSYDPFPRRSL